MSTEREKHPTIDKSDYQLTRMDRRSLAFQTAIAEKLRHNPAPVVPKGRANLARLSALHTALKATKLATASPNITRLTLLSIEAVVLPCSR